MLPLTRDQVRAIDQRATSEFHVPSILLMENAGRSAAEILLRLGCDGAVVVLCGKGNNAGDGLVVARHLDAASVPVKILSVGDPARLAWRRCNQLLNCQVVRHPVENLEWVCAGTDLLTQAIAADWIVDALLGTGATGAPRAPMDQLIRLANAAPSQRFALDIPSGLDCDTGESFSPTFRTTTRVHLSQQKRAFRIPPPPLISGPSMSWGLGAPRQSLVTRT